MLQKIGLSLLVIVLSIGFPAYILLRPARPRTPQLVQVIERMPDSGLRWKATFEKKPHRDDTRQAVEFLKKTLHTLEEPTVKIDDTNAVIEFKKRVDETLLVDSYSRLRVDDTQADFSLKTSPWMEKEDDLKPVISAIQEIDSIPGYFNQTKLTVVQHPHNPDSRYVMVSFSASATH